MHRNGTVRSAQNWRQSAFQCSGKSQGGGWGRGVVKVNVIKVESEICLFHKLTEERTTSNKKGERIVIREGSRRDRGASDNLISTNRRFDRKVARYVYSGCIPKGYTNTPAFRKLPRTRPRMRRRGSLMLLPKGMIILVPRKTLMIQ